MNQEDNNTNTEEYLRFLEEVMQAVSESQGNSAPVHAILRENLKHLDLTFARILRIWAVKIIEKETFSQVAFIANILYCFHLFLSDSPYGSKANKIEISITCLEICLKVFPQDRSLVDWIKIQNNLGIAYHNRIRGEHKDNLEKAIACYQSALQVCTYDSFPKDWAILQINLGFLYCDRIKGKRQDNLEKAITHCQAALQVLTCDAFPKDWANTQISLGLAYAERIKGEHQDNLERAISCYQKALQIYTRNTFPQDRAIAQNNLGETYRRRIKGERQDNLEKAIACYQAALHFYTRDKFPYEWALLQDNLGNAYSSRIGIAQNEYIEKAIAYYQEALQVLTRNEFPKNWATTQNNLGNTYSKRITGDRRENLEKAVGYLQEVLEILNRKSFPEHFAKVQYNLGNAFNELFKELGNPEDLTRAITAYKQAVSIYEEGAYGSEPFAQILYRLGYALMQQGSYSQAISTLERARILQSQRKDIIGLATTLFTLARLYHRTNYFQEARLYFKESLRLFRRLQYPKKIAAVLTSLGNVEMQLLRFDCARDHLEEARTYYDSHNNTPRLAEVNKLLNWIEEELENVNSQSLQSNPAKVGS